MPLILLAAFALRLYRLGVASLWYDETVSTFLARQDLVALTRHTAGDIHPPLYYYLLHFWGQFAGWSEFAFAFASLFFGVLLIALVYRVDPQKNQIDLSFKRVTESDKKRKMEILRDLGYQYLQFHDDDAVPDSAGPADLEKIAGLFARLETPIEYDAVDNQPVDLVFMLLAPEGAGADHLKALARVSRLLRNQTACEKLRAAKSAEALYAILTEPSGNANSVAA